MKKLLVLLPLFAGFLTMNAQKPFVINENGGPKITCDQMSFDTEENVYEFTGNVNFQSPDIQIENAQKVILNTRTQKLKATAFEKVTVSGTLVSYGECEENNLEYKLGRKRLKINRNCL